MTLLQLKYYCTACECESITKAAKKIFVTQPTITSAIRELEKEYSIQLLDRKGKGLCLTGEGREFYQQAAAMLEHAREFDCQIRDIAGKKRRIRLGITKSAGSFAYAEYFPYGYSCHPDLDIQLHTAPSAWLLENLRDQQLDVILIPDQGSDPMKDLERADLKETEMLYCMSKDHLLAFSEKITVPMIVNEKMVSTKHDKNKNDSLRRLFSKYGYDQEPKVIQRFDQLNTAMQMVEANVGTGYFPAEGISQYKGIVGRRIEGNLPIPVCAVWSREGWRREEVRKFIRCLKTFYREHLHEQG